MGITLKFGDRFQVGDFITVGAHSGRVLEFGNRALKIVGALGDEMLVSYRLISKEVMIGQKSTPKVLSKTIVLEQAVGGETDVKQKINKAICTNPWIIISSPVGIGVEDGRVTVSFYVLNNEFFEKAKRRLLKDLA